MLRKVDWKLTSPLFEQFVKSLLSVDPFGTCSLSGACDLPGPSVDLPVSVVWSLRGFGSASPRLEDVSLARA